MVGKSTSQTRTAVGLPVLSRFFNTLSAAAVVGAMSVVFVLSFASIIYAGPIAPFLSQGIALTLIGAIIMALVGAMTLSYRGTLVQPQDVSTILLSLCAASIAALPGLSAQSAFSTVVVVVGVTSVAMGLAAFAMGRLRLGNLVRFVPFPVVSGFLAASGTLLVRGAMTMVVPDFSDMADLLAKWPLWLPWLVVSIGILSVSRLSSGGGMIPLSLLLALAGFYAVTSALGLDMAAMRRLGLLLGPFEGASFASELSFNLLADVHWWVVFAQFPMIVAIVGISLLGMLLNASVLELSLERELDFERELKGVGLANLAVGIVGGPLGYHSLSKTMLARRFGAYGTAVGFGVAAIIGFALFFGGGVLASLPIGLFAAVVCYLGLNQILTAFRDHGRIMPRLELGIVLIMPLIALVFGFMAAVSFGLSVAVLLFVITYSRVDATRLSTTAANFHARVERHPRDVASLADLGGCVRIDRLEGFLFFGSASRLVERIQAQLMARPEQRYAIVDLERVVGLDMSAWAAFERLGRSCSQRGVRMIMTGLSPELATHFGRFDTQKRGHFRVAEDLDDVLTGIENELLAASSPAQKGEDEHNLEADFVDLLLKTGHRIELSAGQELFAQGAQGDHLVILLSGRLYATTAETGKPRRVVNRFVPGAIVGEIALYTGVTRTATIVAETDAIALRIDAVDLAQLELDDPAAAMRFHRTLAVLLARRLVTARRLLEDAEL